MASSPLNIHVHQIRVTVSLRETGDVNLLALFCRRALQNMFNDSGSKETSNYGEGTDAQAVGGIL